MRSMNFGELILQQMTSPPPFIFARSSFAQTLKWYNFELGIYKLQLIEKFDKDIFVKYLFADYTEKESTTAIWH